MRIFYAPSARDALRWPGARVAMDVFTYPNGDAVIAAALCQAALQELNYKKHTAFVHQRLIVTVKKPLKRER